jgi:hypothetical protein
MTSRRIAAAVLLLVASTVLAGGNAPALAVGDAVVAYWEGSYFPGKVKALFKTEVEIAWEDGSDPSRKPRSSVERVPKNEKRAVSVGQEGVCFADKSERLWACKVEKVNATGVSVSYATDGSKADLRWDQFIVPVGKPDAAAPAKAAGGNAAPQDGATCDGPGQARWCGGQCVNIAEDNAHCGGCSPCKAGYHCDHMFCRDAAGNL